MYVLFMLALAMHPQAPSIFSVDSFDHALTLRLAKKMIQIFCEQVIQHKKHVFLTNHNPLVLDGLWICAMTTSACSLWTGTPTVMRKSNGFLSPRS